MTEQQKISIRVLREQNFSYVAISRILELTLGAVRSYCQRCGLGGNRKEAFQADKPMFSRPSANAAESRSFSGRRLSPASSALMNAG